MNDQWIKWTGDRPFRGDKLLSVRFRTGKIAGTHAGPTILPASSWHGLWDKGPGWPFDIIEVLPIE